MQYKYSFSHFLNSMIVQVMLSQPIPPLDATSSAIIVSKSSSTTEETLSFPLFFFNLSATKLIASQELMQSQIPSQARIMKSQSAAYFSTKTSGKAVTIQSYAFNMGFPLYSKSPNALDKASIPLTLPSSTQPLALSILLFSLGKSGL